MDDDVVRALAGLRQELAILKSALGVHSARDAEAVIQRLVFAVENMGGNQQQDEGVIAQLVTAAENQAADILALRRDVAVLSGIIAATHPVTTHGSLSYAPMVFTGMTMESLSAHGSLAGAPYVISGTIVPVQPSNGGLVMASPGFSGVTEQPVLEAAGGMASGVYSTAGAVIVGEVLYALLDISCPGRIHKRY